MPAALLNQGRTALRDSLKTLISHIVVSTDATPFNATQTTANPGGGTNLIKTSTEVDVDAFTFDAQISISGDTEFTGLNINTIAPANGNAAINALARVVRTNPIGVQAGDAFTVGIRVQVQDAS